MRLFFGHAGYAEFYIERALLFIAGYREYRGKQESRSASFPVVPDERRDFLYSIVSGEYRFGNGHSRCGDFPVFI